MRFLANLLRLVIGLPFVAVGIVFGLAAVACFIYSTTDSGFLFLAIGCVLLYLGLRFLPKWQSKHHAAAHA
jgi:ABC-type spermidine/putrescine transport system permease subunit II